MARYLDQYDDDEENAAAAARLGLDDWRKRRYNAEHNRRYKARQKGAEAPFEHVDPELVGSGIRKPPRADQEVGCLEWQRARNSRGYGHVHRDGRTVYVHRLSLERKLGRPLGPGMRARHTCDNRRCFEPDHLIEGTQHESVHDTISRGRAAWQRRES